MIIIIINFLNYMFDWFGLVTEIVTDNGTQFRRGRDVLEDTCNLAQLGGSVRQANGEVESFNSVMNAAHRFG